MGTAKEHYVNVPLTEMQTFPGTERERWSERSKEQKVTVPGNVPKAVPHEP